MIKRRFPLFIFSFFIYGCSNTNPNCDSSLEIWRDGASKELEAFKPAHKEIIANKSSFINSSKDSTEFSVGSYCCDKNGRTLPEIKKWLTKHPSGYISYKKDVITVQYENCGGTAFGYDAYLYHSSKGTDKFDSNMVAKTFESYPLGSDWYHLVTKCGGCGL